MVATAVDRVDVRQGSRGRFTITSYWGKDVKVAERSAAEVDALYVQLLTTGIIDRGTARPKLHGVMSGKAYMFICTCVVAASAAALATVVDSPEALIALVEAKNAESREQLTVTVCSVLGAVVCGAGAAYIAAGYMFAKRYDRAVGSASQFLQSLVGEARAVEHVRALLEPSEREDWPSSFGEINLGEHDLPHPKSETEWWYYNAHLRAETGEEKENSGEYSVFVCFFRFLKHVDKSSGKRFYSHALTWALSDVENEKYYTDVLLESDSPQMILKSLDRGDLMKDPIISRALREVLLKGNVPLPDRLFTNAPVVNPKKLSIEYETSTLTKDVAGNYILSATHPNLPCSLDLTFEPQKAPGKRCIRTDDSYANT